MFTVYLPPIIFTEDSEDHRLTGWEGDWLPHTPLGPEQFLTHMILVSAWYPPDRTLHSQSPWSWSSLR